MTNRRLRQAIENRPFHINDEHDYDPSHLNFVEAFECYVCKKVHDNLDKELDGDPVTRRWANKSHYGCPKRKKFDQYGKYVAEADWRDYWSSEWERQLKIAKVLRECVKRNLYSCRDYILKNS